MVVMPIIIMQTIIFIHVFPTIINNFSKLITLVRANFILRFMMQTKVFGNDEKFVKHMLNPSGAAIVIKAFPREFDTLHVTNLKMLYFP